MSKKNEVIWEHMRDRIEVSTMLPGAQSCQCTTTLETHLGFEIYKIFIRLLFR